MSINQFNIPGSGNFLFGEASFSGSDTTVEVQCGGWRKVSVLSLVNLRDHAQGDHLEVDETTTDAVIDVPSTGSITIKRSAGTTSNAAFTYWIMGF